MHILNKLCYRIHTLDPQTRSKCELSLGSCYGTWQGLTRSVFGPVGLLGCETSQTSMDRQGPAKTKKKKWHIFPPSKPKTTLIRRLTC